MQSGKERRQRIAFVAALTFSSAANDMTRRRVVSCRVQIAIFSSQTATVVWLTVFLALPSVATADSAVRDRKNKKKKKVQQQQRQKEVRRKSRIQIESAATAVVLQRLFRVNGQQNKESRYVAFLHLHLHLLFVVF